MDPVDANADADPTAVGKDEDDAATVGVAASAVSALVSTAAVSGQFVL